MNIIVFIKQVADTEARIIIKSDKTSLEIENKYAMNFFDEFAVEEALRIREKAGEGQVTVVTFGSNKAIEALRTAIAMGADRAFLIDNGGIEDDSLVKAKILSAFASKEGFDLILSGRQAIDDESSVIGPMAAELLNNKALTENDTEGGKDTSEVLLPALFTAQKGLNEPRVPLITGVMKAMKAAIPVIDPETLVTLDDRNYRSGLIEVIKHGLVRDSSFFEYFVRHTEAILSRNHPDYGLVMTELMTRNSKIKNEIVSKDPREKNLRKILNYGHTSGHAVEHLSGYSLLHGEAIAIGIACEAFFSKKLGICKETDYERQVRLISSFGLPIVST